MKIQYWVSYTILTILISTIYSYIGISIYWIILIVPIFMVSLDSLIEAIIKKNKSEEN